MSMTPAGMKVVLRTVGISNLVGGAFTVLLGAIGYVWASEPATGSGPRGVGLMQVSAVSLAVGLVGVIVLGCSVAFMLGYRKAWLPLGLFDGAWLFGGLWLAWHGGAGWFLTVPVAAWLVWQCWALRE
ncbi:hypothetical protein COSO111634_18400 [Corallococcus soli]|nr:MAG: hypothetical protein EOO70_10170 [Myxococcaceae bacterium]